MYVYIMKHYQFPYGVAKYATIQEVESCNKLIAKKDYDGLLKTLPNFWIACVDCQPNECDLEPYWKTL